MISYKGRPAKLVRYILCFLTAQRFQSTGAAYILVTDDKCAGTAGLRGFVVRELEDRMVLARSDLPWHAETQLYRYINDLDVP
jgi:hypothetical protein